MKSFSHTIFCFLLLGTMAGAYAQFIGSTATNIELLLTSPDSLRLQKIYYHNELIDFYKVCRYQPVWKENHTILAMVSAIKSAGDEGLSPTDYHQTEIEKILFIQPRTDFQKAQLDILLTDAFVRYGTHLLSGKIDPVMLHGSDWETTVRKSDLFIFLRKALQEQDLNQALDELKPNYKEYRVLKQALHYYQRLQAEGGWPTTPPGASLEVCMTDDRVVYLRQRLLISGYLSDEYRTGNPAYYDSLLFAAVVRFQQQHGLSGDGVIGASTLKALNYTPADYIQKLTVNLERYRWMPHMLPDRYVGINIPGFYLVAVESDSIVMRMKVIVGRSDRQTPVINSYIRYLILYPTWTVPPTILREDALPGIRKSLSYLTKNDLKVYNYLNEEINPAEIPWHNYTAQNFPYVLKHQPGGSNPLGIMKFQFPNHHLVFMHDTNHHGLFANSYRALSSGCIRLEHPLALAMYLFRDTSWTQEKLNQLILQKKTVTITFPVSEPIHLFYFTASVEDGEVKFYDDVYGWDAMLGRALATY